MLCPWASSFPPFPIPSTRHRTGRRCHSFSLRDTPAFLGSAYYQRTLRSIPLPARTCPPLLRKRCACSQITDLTLRWVIFCCTSSEPSGTCGILTAGIRKRIVTDSAEHPHPPAHDHACAQACTKSATMSGRQTGLVRLHTSYAERSAV